MSAPAEFKPIGFDVSGPTNLPSISSAEDPLVLVTNAGFSGPQVRVVMAPVAGGTARESLDSAIAKSRRDGFEPVLQEKVRLTGVPSVAELARFESSVPGTGRPIRQEVLMVDLPGGGLMSLTVSAAPELFDARQLGLIARTARV